MVKEGEGDFWAEWDGGSRKGVAKKTESGKGGGENGEGGLDGGGEEKANRGRDEVCGG